MDEIGDDLVVMQKGASDIFGGFVPEATVDRIAAIPGVVRASGELLTFAPSDAGRSVLTLGWPTCELPLEKGAAARGPRPHRK